MTDSESLLLSHSGPEGNRDDPNECLICIEIRRSKSIELISIIGIELFF